MRILLADDQPEVRTGLRLLFEQEPDMRIVGEIGDLQGLPTEVARVQPDLLLIDWELSPLKMGDTLPILKRIHPGLRIVALSGRPEGRKTALASGADAFVSKGDPPERVLAVLRREGRPETGGGSRAV